MISAPLYRRLGSKHRINRRAQRFRAVDDEQATPRRIDAMLDQVLE